MNVKISFNGMASSVALKEQLEGRLDKLKKYVNYPVEVLAVMSVEKLTHRVEITCHAEHRQLFSECESNDMHESIDLCARKLEAQLKKERDRRKGHASSHRVLAEGELAGTDLGAQIPHRGKR